MRVKICGITSISDAAYAEACGADAIGVVLFSASPRSVPPDRAERIFRSLSPFTLTVAVTHSASEEDLARVIALRPGAVQVYHPFPMELLHGLKVFRVIQPGSPLPDDCDAIVVDSSHGKGKRFDTVFARDVVQRSPLPVILAGGLTPENVRDAIGQVRPHAVDVASGVEDSPGIKDPEKVRTFIRICRGEDG